MHTDTMKDQVIIHGIEYVPKVVPESVKVGRWKPEIGGIFWYVSSDGRYAFRESYSNNDSNVHMCLYGNMYQTQELATQARDKRLLLVELQDYADQCNELKELPKHCYFLIKDGNKWEWTSSSTRNPGNIRFENSADARSAIAHFGSRLDLLL